MATVAIEFEDVSGDDAGGHLDELSDLYTEVYAEPPYEWGPDRTELFRTRFEVQRGQPGFALVEARVHGQLVAVAFGVTLQPTTPWWQNLLTPLPSDITEEHSGRTWALVEMLVRPPWRRLHIAQVLHDRLLDGRPEERATLTVLPAAEPARAAYAKWGWHPIGQKRNPLPATPPFDILLKKIRN